MSDRFQAPPLATDDLLRLLADHADDPSAELPGWQQALDAVDCLDPDDPAEARLLNEALDADPLLLFRRLPAAEMDAGELAAMKRSVHELRRARAIDSESGTSVPAAPSPRRWRRLVRDKTTLRLAAALAAAVLTAALLLPSLSNAPIEPSELPVASADAAFDALSLQALTQDLPLVENYTGDGTLIQIEDPGMSLVVVAATDMAIADTGADRL